MNIQELADAARDLTFEQRKELIKTLYAQQPKPDSQSASVIWVGDLEAGTQALREQVNTALEQSAHDFYAPTAEP